MITIGREENRITDLHVRPLGLDEISEDEFLIWRQLAAVEFRFDVLIERLEQSLHAIVQQFASAEVERYLFSAEAVVREVNFVLKAEIDHCGHARPRPSHLRKTRNTSASFGFRGFASGSIRRNGTFSSGASMSK